jgi:hypothetical protein
MALKLLLDSRVVRAAHAQVLEELRQRQQARGRRQRERQLGGAGGRGSSGGGEAPPRGTTPAGEQRTSLHALQLPLNHDQRMLQGSARMHRLTPKPSKTLQTKP